MSDTPHTPQGADDAVARARALPDSVEPRRDLWPAIRSRLAAASRRSGRWPSARTALAASILIGVACGASFWLGRLTAPHQESGWIAAPSDVRFGPHYTLGRDFVRARIDLNLILGDELARISPEMRSTVEANLAAIEEAVEDLNRALSGNPNSVMLQQMLLSAYTQELVLLREVNGLVRTVREGTET